MAGGGDHAADGPAERVAFVLIDGIGDVSVPQLNHRTPLEAASTPHLDAIAGGRLRRRRRRCRRRRPAAAAAALPPPPPPLLLTPRLRRAPAPAAAGGFNGLLDPVEPGLACGSDTAHMSLFGYDPRALYAGRGAFESMGAGLRMDPGDIAFKCNFACLAPAPAGARAPVVALRRVDRRFEEEGPPLCAALDGLAIPGFPRHALAVRYATEHRCGVVIRGPGLSDAVSGTDPLKDGLPLLAAAPVDATPAAARTAAVVNAACAAMRAALAAHPVNLRRAAEGKPPADVVLLRGCGRRLALAPFGAAHGMRAAMVAPTKIIAGLGMCAGVEVLQVEGTTGDYRTLFHRKAEAVAEALGPGEWRSRLEGGRLRREPGVVDARCARVDHVGRC
jgi:2,3-bisphosphoglycerate-independent phosphoglycerate mutase